MVEHELKIVEEAIAALDKYYDLYNKSRNAISLIEASTLMRTLLPSDHTLRKRCIKSEYDIVQIAMYKKGTKLNSANDLPAEALW